MTDPILTLLTMAGFLYAQITSEVSNSGTDNITPVAFVIDGREQRLTTFPGKSLEEMVRNGRNQIKQGDFEASAFGYEGFFLVDGVRKSVLFIEMSSRDAPKPRTVMQFWRSNSYGQREPLGPPMFLADAALPDVSSKRVDVPNELSEQEERAFRNGITRHDELRRKSRASN